MTSLDTMYMAFYTMCSLEGSSISELEFEFILTLDMEFCSIVFLTTDCDK